MLFRSVGLGLILSKRLVEAMDGAFGVESRLGKGTSFFLELDEADPQAGVPAGRAESVRP